MTEGTNEREFTFTKARIERLLVPPSGRVEYRDTEQPGLTLRVSASGVKSFSAFLWVTAERKRERITVGKFPAVSVDTARRRVAELIGKVATGANPADEKRQYLTQGTLGEAFDAYAKNRRAAKKRAVDAMEAQFNRWLGKVPDAPKAKHAPHPRRKPAAAVDWSKRRIGTITPADCRDLHRAIVAAGKPTSANRVQEILRAVFNFAGITPNPAATAGRGNQHGVERVKLAPRRRFLSRDELPRFLEVIEALEPNWRDFFNLLLYVGFRRSAVAAMRWADVDLEAATWRVPEEKSKSGEPIVLPIAGPALAILTRRAKYRKTRNPWVFPAESESGHLINPKKAWERIRAAGFADLRMHDLRRTLGSWMAAANISPLVIAKSLGHKDPRSAQAYTWLATDAARSAVESVHAAFASAVRGGRKRAKARL
jgi:integrase